MVIVNNSDASYIRNSLRERFGVPPERTRRPVLDELILTILSQNTTDTNRDRAYRALQDKYSTWEDVLEGGVEVLEPVISPAGLGPTRSKRIMQILTSVRKAGGPLLFENICRLPRDEAKKKLLALPGVGPKTASCVLLFSCGMAAFPVDTHIYRVCRRFGLVPEKVGRESSHEILEACFPEEDYLEIHLNLIRLGRTVCRPKTPLCRQCPLSAHCDHHAKMRLEIGND